MNKKIPDTCNAKEHYQSFLRKKNTKTLHKLSKTEKIYQAGSTNFLYSETKKSKFFLNKQTNKQTNKKYKRNTMSTCF